MVVSQATKCKAEREREREKGMAQFVVVVLHFLCLFYRAFFCCRQRYKFTGRLLVGRLFPHPKSKIFFCSTHSL